MSHSNGGNIVDTTVDVLDLENGESPEKAISRLAVIGQVVLGVT